jgi:hypothetical protein
MNEHIYLIRDLGVISQGSIFSGKNTEGGVELDLSGFC